MENLELLKKLKFYDIEIEDNSIIIYKPNFIAIPKKNLIIEENDTTINFKCVGKCNIILWKNVKNIHISIF